MAFGQQQAPAAAGGSAENWELRTLTFTESQDKTTQAGKVFWRVKDTNSFWYSVWEPAVYASIEIAAGNNEAIPCAVQIKPGRNGGKPFYTIAGVNAAAESMVAEGKTKVSFSMAPGGRGSEFGKRMHPDDAIRVTMLASLERANQMVAMTLADKPEGVSYETFVKGKVFEYANWINAMVTTPLTPTPKPEVPAPALKEGTEVDAGDNDIPF